MKAIDFERAKRAAQPTQKPSLYAALARAKAEFPEIIKNRVATVRMKSGGQYSYNYADLSDILSATTPALSAYGLFAYQEVTQGGVVTHVVHESGERKTDAPWPIKPMPARDLSDAQSFQSAVQVARRYSMCAALGISAEETLEGDYSRKRGLPEAINEEFETGDGVRMPVGAKFKRDMTARQKAEEAARAIIEQFEGVKTQVGVNGVWSRNEDFIALLQEKHDDLYAQVFDAFERHMDDKPGPT
jgi:hypothetical protein